MDEFKQLEAKLSTNHNEIMAILKKLQEGSIDQKSANKILGRLTQERNDLNEEIRKIMMK